MFFKKLSSLFDQMQNFGVLNVLIDAWNLNFQNKFSKLDRTFLLDEVNRKMVTKHTPIPKQT